MSRQIITKVGNEPKKGKETGTQGVKRVTDTSTSLPKGGVSSSASGSSATSGGSTGDPLIDDIGNAITNLKHTGGSRTRIDELFRKLQEGIRKGSGTDVSEALTRIEDISKSHHDRNLIRLLSTLKERTQNGQSTEIGMSGDHATSLQESVNMWLMTLKNDIQTDSCTLSFQKDIPTELKTTRDLLQEIINCLKENHIRKTWENNSLRDEINFLDKEIAVLAHLRPGGWKDGDTHWQRLSHLRQKLKQEKVQPSNSVNEDRKKDETFSSKLADQEKKIQDIWAQLVQTQTTRSQDHLAMLNDIEKYLKENKRSVETVNKDRGKEGMMSPKLPNQEQKIQDIWAQLEQTTTTRSQDHLAMLNDIEKRLKENKREVETLQANEKILHEHIDELQKELETSDSESYLKGIQETGKESELVKKVILIRKKVHCNLENRVTNSGADIDIIQKQVIDIWNLLLGAENNDPKVDKDINILLGSIHEELKILEKSVVRVEESCLNIYQSLFESNMPVQRKNTTNNERLTGIITVLSMCKEEAESIGKCLIQFYSVFDIKVKGSLSRQCEQLTVTVERRSVAREPVLENVLNMHTRTLQQKYIPSNKPTAESGRSQRKEWDVLNGPADDLIAVVVDICDQVATKYESLQNTLVKREQEKAELLTRLSQMAGANLTNNNPSIADLSDPNRPTKLSEMYSELYDNAWTDAFEALDKRGKDNKDKEQTNIQLLLEILSESYKTCEDVSQRQQQAIMAALTDPTPGLEKKTKDKSSKKYQPSALQSKAVTDLRKLSADTFVPSVQLFFEENCLKEKGSEKKRSIWVDNEPVKKYTMKCIELCWLMHIQAPPVHIDLTGQQDDKFDTNKFKQYTKSGNKIHFVVWPPLLLHEEGPLLSKGVAQGK